MGKGFIWNCINNLIMYIFNLLYFKLMGFIFFFVVFLYINICRKKKWCKGNLDYIFFLFFIYSLEVNKIYYWFEIFIIYLNYYVILI